MNAQFDKTEKVIGPGEYYATAEDIVISTLLGSCIAVALYEPFRKVGGLNHFMLPGIPEKATVYSAEARYGIQAMELLINDLFKLGAVKKMLHAKVFGGSSMLEYEKATSFNVAKKNIEFVFEFLETEKIPVESYSVGGAVPRKVFFFPASGRVLMKYTTIRTPGLANRERRYSETLLENARNAGKPIIF